MSGQRLDSTALMPPRHGAAGLSGACSQRSASRPELLSCESGASPRAGIDGFGFEDRRLVQQAFKDLRMDRAAARAVLDDVARK